MNVHTDITTHALWPYDRLLNRKQYVLKAVNAASGVRKLLLVFYLPLLFKTSVWFAGCKMFGLKVIEKLQFTAECIHKVKCVTSTMQEPPSSSPPPPFFPNPPSQK